jgi:hypothetical protein
MEWLLSVLADPAATLARKDRAACALLPFTCRRMAENVIGKKDQAEANAAIAVATGKYRPGDPPSAPAAGGWRREMPATPSKYLPGDPPVGYRGEGMSWLLRAPEDEEC